MQCSRRSNNCPARKALGSGLRTTKTNNTLKTDLGFSSEARLLSVEVFLCCNQPTSRPVPPPSLSGRLMTRASEPSDSPGVTFLYKCKLCTCLLRQSSTCLPLLCWAHRVPCSSRGTWKSAGLTLGAQFLSRLFPPRAWGLWVQSTCPAVERVGPLRLCFDTHAEPIL